MSPVRWMRSFAGRHRLAGPIAWQLTAQYFVVQVVVASGWSAPPYSWRRNAISDLGATSCGMFDGRQVCSPLHALMNVSLVVLGLSMIVGSVLIHQDVRHSGAGFTMMTVAGVGAVLVGLFPENTVYWAHLTGADLAFLVGNAALVVFGLSRDFPTWLRRYATASGVVALAALVLFLTHHHLFLGLGGMERVVAYPQTLWLIITGIYLSQARNRPPARATSR